MSPRPGLCGGTGQLVSLPRSVKSASCRVSDYLGMLIDPSISSMKHDHITTRRTEC